MPPQACPLPCPSGSDGASSRLLQKEDETALLKALHPREIMLTIRTVQDRKIEFYVLPHSTVLSLKMKIASALNVDVEHQRLLFSGKMLEDDASLEYYDITHRNTLQLGMELFPLLTVMLTVTPGAISALPVGFTGFKPKAVRKRVEDSEVQIFVKNLNGKTMALMVSPYDTVESLLEKVEERTQIPPDQQRLLHAGKQLAPGKILADFDIQKESTIHLGKWSDATSQHIGRAVLRLRGGFMGPLSPCKFTS